MYQKILVAVDGSEHSKRAAAHAAGIAAASRASADMLYVLDHDRSRPQDYDNISKEKLEERIRGRLADVTALFNEKGIEPGLQIQYGEPGPAIVKFINTADYDLVVVGSRGLNTFQEMVLGSVSHKVAKRAECPVLLVK